MKNGYVTLLLAVLLCGCSSRTLDEKTADRLKIYGCRLNACSAHTVRVNREGSERRSVLLRTHAPDRQVRMDMPKVVEEELAALGCITDQSTCEIRLETGPDARYRIELRGPDRSMRTVAIDAAFDGPYR